MTQQEKIEEISAQLFAEYGWTLEMKALSKALQEYGQFIREQTLEEVEKYLSENKQNYKLFDGDIITGIVMPKVRELLQALKSKS